VDVFGQILQPHKVFECPGISTYMYIIESFGIKIAQRRGYQCLSSIPIIYKSHMGFLQKYGFTETEQMYSTRKLHQTTQKK
jgi:hypothetical protein